MNPQQKTTTLHDLGTEPLHYVKSSQYRHHTLLNDAQHDTKLLILKNGNTPENNDEFNKKNVKTSTESSQFY